MGFFSKIGKGIKSVFKTIGKGIQSAFKKVGKFMDRIGVLGQVAMMFILPGVGSMLAKAWSGIAGQTATQAALSTVSQTAATTAAQGGANAAASTTAGELAKKVAMEGLKEGGKKAATALIKQTGAKATGLMAGGNFAQGVGKLMQFTSKVVGTPGRVFSNITQGVTDTLGNFAKTASNNIFGSNFTTAAGNSLNGKFFSGGDSAFGRSFGDTSKFANVLAKSPTITTKQARSDFKAGITGPPAVAGQGPLTDPKFQVKESDMYKMPDTPLGLDGQTLRPEGAFNNLGSRMKPGGKIDFSAQQQLDLSQPVKDLQYNTNEFGGNQFSPQAKTKTGQLVPGGKRAGKSFLRALVLVSIIRGVQ